VVTPIEHRCAPSTAKWPPSLVTDPADQITLLRQKYLGREKGRIPLPASPQELWAHAASRESVRQLLACTQRLALRFRDRFLLSSTALSELALFTGD